jgi:putative colanic acid biosynthesis UDP-glucose lipid carrier transferase
LYRHRRVVAVARDCRDQRARPIAPRAPTTELPVVNRFSTAQKIVDPFVVAFAGLFAYYLRFRDLELPANYRIAILAVFALAILILGVLDVYRWRPEEGIRRVLGRLVVGWSGIVLALIVLLYATKTGSVFSRAWLATWSATSFAGLLGYRILWMQLVRRFYRRGLFVDKIAIAGAGNLGREIAARLARSPGAGARVVAFFDDAPQFAGAVVEGVPVRGTIEDLPRWLQETDVDQVWVALPLRAEERVKSLLESLAARNTKVRFVPDIFGFRLLNHSVTEVVGLPVLNLTEPPLAGLKSAVKWVEDKLLALFILALIWPVLLVLAIAVKLSSPGPVLFKQRRGGIDNRPIVVWKFRSMKVHDELAVSALPQAQRNDPRVTRVGAWLRRTSLDELPQFINVLLGDMSIVGPRPHASWMDDFYRSKIPTYALRSWIKPGITGWAQVCGWRGETDELWKMEMRIQHDLYYMENWSLGLDLVIILMTIFRLRSPRAY